MELPVLIEPMNGKGFRASGGDPLNLTAEGATREEALHRLRLLVDSRLQNGVEIVPMALSAPANPWLAMAGQFKDNPLYDEWIETMAENRRKDDEETLGS